MLEKGRTSERFEASERETAFESSRMGLPGWVNLEELEMLLLEHGDIGEFGGEVNDAIEEGVEPRSVETSPEFVESFPSSWFIVSFLFISVFS